MLTIKWSWYPSYDAIVYALPESVAKFDSRVQFCVT